MRHLCIPQMITKTTRRNPVLDSAKLVYQATDFVTINALGVKSAANYLHQQIQKEEYSPRTWRTHPLHFLSPEPYDPQQVQTKQCLDWIFFVSSLNFSFWSDLSEERRYGVEWYENGWRSAQSQAALRPWVEVEPKGEKKKKVWTGYWSLLAGINRALERGIPITDPKFYSSLDQCPDILLQSVFASHAKSEEMMPILKERIVILRQVGSLLCEKFGGSYQGLLKYFEETYGPQRTALDFIGMITEEFDSFKDENMFEGQKVFFWKRAQILAADTWAAFYPASKETPHPFFPYGVGELTMFADYRVPQILHDLDVISYSPTLTHLLAQPFAYLENGSMEEMSIRAASIIAVEQVRTEMNATRREGTEEITSVLIDFFLWDLAKKVGEGDNEEALMRKDGLLTPIHRTRSIWY